MRLGVIHFVFRRLNGRAGDSFRPDLKSRCAGRPVVTYTVYSQPSASADNRFYLDVESHCVGRLIVFHIVFLSPGVTQVMHYSPPKFVQFDLFLRRDLDRYTASQSLIISRMIHRGAQ
jgi:hypothetical protein